MTGDISYLSFCNNATSAVCSGEYESIMLVHERDLHLGLAHCYNGDCVNCDSNKVYRYVISIT